MNTDHTNISETPIQSSDINLDSDIHLERPIDHIYDIDRDECQCYNCSTENESEHFLNAPHILSSTVNALSNSNIPSSGTFHAKLVRSVSYVRLPSEWLNIPLKSGKDENAPKSFSGNYTTFFYKILKAFNPFCCFTFKRNYIKRDNSRTGGCPFWRGTVACKHEDVVAHLTIQARNENILKIEFTGDVNHAI